MKVDCPHCWAYGYIEIDGDCRPCPVCHHGDGVFRGWLAVPLSPLAAAAVREVGCSRCHSLINSL